MTEDKDIIKEALLFKIEETRKVIEIKRKEIEDLEGDIYALDSALAQLTFAKPKPTKKDSNVKFRRLFLDKSLQEIALDAIKASPEPMSSHELFDSLNLEEMPKFESFRSTLSALLTKNKVTRKNGRYSLPKRRT